MEPNKKQTAVEWFIEELFKKIDYTQVPQKLIDQAKEMEKEQHENTWYAGDEDGAIHEFEYYWEETYGGNK
jgi:hypothetical protein